MKKKRIFAFGTVMVIGLLIFCTVPYIVKFIYNNTNDFKTLYFLCQISTFYRKDEFIIEYVPKLLEDDEICNIVDDFHKDELLSEYLDSLLELDDFQQQQNALKKSFELFSGLETAIPNSTSFIFSYYDMTGDLEKSKIFFEILLDSSENIGFEYKNGIYTKYLLFLLEVEDYKTVQKVREERIYFLKSNGIDIWDEDMQSEHLGDGAILDKTTSGFGRFYD